MRVSIKTLHSGKLMRNQRINLSTSDNAGPSTQVQRITSFPSMKTSVEGLYVKFVLHSQCERIDHNR